MTRFCFLFWPVLFVPNARARRTQLYKSMSDPARRFSLSRTVTELRFLSRIVRGKHLRCTLRHSLQSSKGKWFALRRLGFSLQVPDARGNILRLLGIPSSLLCECFSGAVGVEASRDFLGQGLGAELHRRAAIIGGRSHNGPSESRKSFRP